MTFFSELDFYINWNEKSLDEMQKIFAMRDQKEAIRCHYNGGQCCMLSSKDCTWKVLENEPTYEQEGSVLEYDMVPQGQCLTYMLTGIHVKVNINLRINSI